MTLPAKLSPKKQKAMEALLAEPTVAGAALAAGISQQALLRFGFLREVRRQLIDPRIGAGSVVALQCREPA